MLVADPAPLLADSCARRSRRRVDGQHGDADAQHESDGGHNAECLAREARTDLEHDAIPFLESNRRQFMVGYTFATGCLSCSIICKRSLDW